MRSKLVWKSDRLQYGNVVNAVSNMILKLVHTYLNYRYNLPQATCAICAKFTNIAEIMLNETLSNQFNQAT